MKKFYFGLLMAFIAMSQLSFAAQPTSPLVAKPTAGAITLDAAGDDAGWADAVWNNIDVIFKGEASGFLNAADLTAKFKVAFDAQKVYFLFDVTDDNIAQDPLAHWAGDKVEVYFGGLNEDYDNAAGAAAVGARQFAIKAQYDKTSLGENGSANYKPASDALETDGVDYEYQETATGYILEMSIDRAIALEGVVDNATIDFDVCIADNDEIGAAVRSRKSWFNDGEITELWSSMLGAGKLTLEAPSAVSTVKAEAPAYVSNGYLIAKSQNQVNIEIYNTNGKRILLANGVNQVNLNSLSTGVYLSKIYSTNGNVLGVYRFIK